MVSKKIGERTMRIGLCCGEADKAAALAAGFDYVELPAASTVPSETTNLFYPGDVKMYGSEADAFERGKAIIEAAHTRGVQLMVLGSGGVRRAPEGEGEDVFYDLAAELDRFAQTLGMRIAPESLNPKESNVGTSLPALAEALHARGCGYTADAYHAMAEAGPGPYDLDFWRAQLPHKPLHVHFASPERNVPTSDDPALRAFAARLKELGYDGRASLEAHRDGIPNPTTLQELFS